MRFLSVSPIRFIQSNYGETFDWENVCLEIRELLFIEATGLPFCYAERHFPVKGKLADLTQESFLLLGTGTDSHWIPYPGWGNTTPGVFIGYLVFEQEPKISGVHELTVTIRLGDGRVLSRTIEKVFE